jgi:hypothetical protein
LNVDSDSLLDQPAFIVSIPEGIIPLEFRASITTTTVSHILPGTAVMPTLSVGEFEHSQRQLNPLYFEERITSLGSLSFPIVQHGTETSSEYGGAVLDIVRTLDDSLLNADEGEDIVSSFVNPIGNALMWFKETKKRPATDAEWPVLPDRLWDDNMREEYDQTRQVVLTGTGEDPDPGGVFGWLSEIKALDKWHSLKTDITRPEPAYVDASTALITYEYKPYRFPGLVYFSGFGYYVRHADATLVQHLVKTWWLKSATTPTVGPTGGGADVEIDEIILDDPVINTLNDLAHVTYAGPTLHDDLQIGVLFYPATTPSYTQYALGTPSGTALGNFATLYTPGSAGGYIVGDVLTLSSGGHTMQVTVTFVYDVGATTGLIGAWDNIPGGDYPAGVYNFILASGGSGTGAYFNVIAIEVPTYTPGTQWIGTYRVIGASVTHEKEKDIWKVQTESVVMR